MATNSDVIHLVHPESQVLLVLYESLSSAGYQVGGSSNGVQALAHIARIRPQAVLSHLEMPEMEARIFLERIKQVSPQTRVLLGSEHTEAALQRQVRAWGGDGLLQEPFQLAHVLQALKVALEQNRSCEVSMSRPAGIAPPEAGRHSGLGGYPLGEVPWHE
jgi:CheY-like chemotaxis protein